MTTLTEFLLARVAEDEVVARRAIDLNDQERARLYGAEPIGATGDSALDVDCDRASVGISTARLLAECEAKRRIVEMWSVRNDQSDHPTIGAHATGLGLAIRALAAVYADHPDYREEWRP